MATIVCIHSVCRINDLSRDAGPLMLEPDETGTNCVVAMFCLALPLDAPQ
jgi:hypothetical protein